MNKIVTKSRQVNRLLLLGLSSLSFILSLAFFETTLRLFPQILPKRISYYLQNNVSIIDKIHYRNVNLPSPYNKVLFMKPNMRTLVFDGNYSWIHETDRFGFRNKEEKDTADIILLGDSNVYGYGIDIDDTLGRHLEHFLGKSVYNMGVIRSCSFQQLYFLRNFGMRLHPKVILYLFFEDDIYNLYQMLDENEMLAFINDENSSKIVSEFVPKQDYGNSVLNHNNNSFKIIDLFHIAQSNVPSILDHLTQTSYAERGLEENNILGAWIKGNHIKLNATFQGKSLGWQYTKKAILQMSNIAKNNDAKLVVVSMTPYLSQMADILREFAAEYKIQFIYPIEVISLKNSQYYLAGNDHLNRKGNETLAKYLIHELRKK